MMILFFERIVGHLGFHLLRDLPEHTSSPPSLSWSWLINDFFSSVVYGGARGEWWQLDASAADVKVECNTEKRKEQKKKKTRGAGYLLLFDWSESLGTRPACSVREGERENTQRKKLRWKLCNSKLVPGTILSFPRNIYKHNHLFLLSFLISIHLIRDDWTHLEWKLLDHRNNIYQCRQWYILFRVRED